MANLKTTYLGLELENPIIVGSCGLTADVDSAKKMEECGAGAIVTKSLFEEQIQLEELQLDEELHEYDDRNAEMGKIHPDIHHAGPEEFLSHIRKIKESVKIPVIGSLNAVFKDSWIDYARQIEETGVDALELNFYHHPTKPEIESKEMIEEQLEVLYKIKSKAKIPVSIKLSPYYTNILRAVHRMNKVGVDGFVMFNRLFQPDIDIDKEEMVYNFNFSNPEDHKLPLRYAGILYNNVKADICSNTGIFSGKDVAKMIMAGATSVQVVSALYKNKPEHIKTMLTELNGWMDEKGYATLEDFRGKLAKINLKDDPFAYKRAHYVNILMKAGILFKKQLQV